MRKRGRGRARGARRGREDGAAGGVGRGVTTADGGGARHLRGSGPARESQARCARGADRAIVPGTDSPGLEVIDCK